MCLFSFRRLLFEQFVLIESLAAALQVPPMGEHMVNASTSSIWEKIPIQMAAMTGFGLVPMDLPLHEQQCIVTIINTI